MTIDSMFLLALSLRPIFGLLLTLLAIFMILLVLVQRGRGGGLAGALGGMGGSSAFGAKAGDTFTKITAVTALIWIMLCIAAAKVGGERQSRVNVDVNAPADAALSAPADAEPINDGGATADEATDGPELPVAGDSADAAQDDADESEAP